MSLAAYKFIAALLVLMITVASGLWPFLRKKAAALMTCHAEPDFPLGESFASGIFLGAGLLHMLPDAAKEFAHAGYHYPLPFLIAASVFLLLLLLEHISVAWQRRKQKLISGIALLTVAMLSIHSLLEGTAVGIAADLTATLIIFLAIIAHKGAASFALAINLNNSLLSFKQRLLAFSFFALMTPLGIFAGDWVALSSHAQPLLTPVFSAMAAGTFLYIGTLHGLDRASLIKNCCNLREFFFMLTGFAIMALVAICT